MQHLLDYFDGACYIISMVSFHARELAETCSRSAEIGANLVNR